MSDRAVSSTVGVALLLVVTVVLAATVGSVALASVPDETTLSTTTAATPVALSVSAADDRLSFTHRAGRALDVDALTLHVTVDGTPLAHQPPVPFFSKTGFRPGPTGPFNAASDGRWSVGETATFRVASTNSPSLEPGARVTVRVATDDRVVARLSTTV